MSNLTVETLRAMLATLPRPELPLNDLLRPGFMGMKIYEAPPPPPKIQVADIKFKDGTSILPAEYRARVNLDLMTRFGFRDDPFKEHAYIFGHSIVMRPEYAAVIRNFCP